MAPRGTKRPLSVCSPPPIHSNVRNHEPNPQSCRIKPVKPLKGCSVLLSNICNTSQAAPSHHLSSLKKLQSEVSELKTKISNLESLLTPLLPLTPLLSPEAKPNSTDLLKAAQLVDSLGSELMQRLHCSYQVLILNVKEKVPVEKAKQALLEICGLDGAKCRSTRLRKLSPSETCPILLEFEDRHTPELLLRHKPLINRHPMFKSARLVPARTPLQRELARFKATSVKAKLNVTGHDHPAAGTPSPQVTAAITPSPQVPAAVTPSPQVTAPKPTASWLAPSFSHPHKLTPNAESIPGTTSLLSLPPCQPVSQLQLVSPADSSTVVNCDGTQPRVDETDLDVQDTEAPTVATCDQKFSHTTPHSNPIAEGVRLPNCPAQTIHPLLKRSRSKPGAHDRISLPTQALPKSRLIAPLLRGNLSVGILGHPPSLLVSHKVPSSPCSPMIKQNITRGHPPILDSNSHSLASDCRAPIVHPDHLTQSRKKGSFYHYPFCLPPIPPFPPPSSCPPLQTLTPPRLIAAELALKVITQLLPLLQLVACPPLVA